MFGEASCHMRPECRFRVCTNCPFFLSEKSRSCWELLLSKFRKGMSLESSKLEGKDDQKKKIEFLKAYFIVTLPSSST